MVMEEVSSCHDIQTHSKQPLCGLSKNQQKKQLKEAKRAEKRRLKKEHMKAQRQHTASLEGRDLEAERQAQLEQTLAGTSRHKHRRELAWQTTQAPRIRQHAFEVCIDCAWTSVDDADYAAFGDFQMTYKEIKSLAMQIRYCYSINKQLEHPCQIVVTGVQPQTTLYQILSRESGFDAWSRRAMTVTTQSLPEYYQLAGRGTSNRGPGDQGSSPPECATTKPIDSLADMTPDSELERKIIYLTSDSENILSNLLSEDWGPSLSSANPVTSSPLQEKKLVLVIGGIVDRNRGKGVALERARDELGVATAQLPLHAYLSALPSTPVLTVNHVFAILQYYYQEWQSLQPATTIRHDAINDGCWTKAFQTVLPVRKGAEYRTHSQASHPRTTTR